MTPPDAVATTITRCASCRFPLDAADQDGGSTVCAFCRSGRSSSCRQCGRPWHYAPCSSCGADVAVRNPDAVATCVWCRTGAPRPRWARQTTDVLRL